MAVTAVVTGAASGIGAALAEHLRSRADRLVLGDVHIDALGPVAERLDAEAVHLDVADPSSMDAFAHVAGSPTLLCLNAGVISTDVGAPWESSPEEWQRMLSVNLGGVVNGLRSFVPGMIERGQPCSILITASLAGLLAWPGGGAYGATKHAVVAVAEQAALALDDTNVSVTLLCPALVRTGMSDVGESPSDVAAAAIQAVEDRRFIVTPDEWGEAISRRAHRIIDGSRPHIPTPTDPGR